jgi:hypothetical protein
MKIICIVRYLLPANTKEKMRSSFYVILLVTTTAYERGSPSRDYSVSREGLGCQKVKFKKKITTHSCK